MMNPIFRASLAMGSRECKGRSIMRMHYNPIKLYQYLSEISKIMTLYTSNIYESTETPSIFLDGFPNAAFAPVGTEFRQLIPCNVIDELGIKNEVMSYVTKEVDTTRYTMFNGKKRLIMDRSLFLYPGYTPPSTSTVRDIESIFKLEDFGPARLTIELNGVGVAADTMVHKAEMTPEQVDKFFMLRPAFSSVAVAPVGQCDFAAFEDTTLNAEVISLVIYPESASNYVGQSLGTTATFNISFAASRPNYTGTDRPLVGLYGNRLQNNVKLLWTAASSFIMQGNDLTYWDCYTHSKVAVNGFSLPIVKTSNSRVQKVLAALKGESEETVEEK